jgi:hypothetical protein
MARLTIRRGLALEYGRWPVFACWVDPSANTARLRQSCKKETAGQSQHELLPDPDDAKPLALQGFATATSGTT